MAETPTTSATDPEGAEPAPGRPSRMRRFLEPTSRAAKIGWSIYQHVVAVFAAFGIAAVISHWWRIGWKGWLETAVGIWDNAVRPVMASVFHYLVTVPLGWVGLDFQVPVVMRDYLSVSAIILLSWARSIIVGMRRVSDQRMVAAAKTSLGLENDPIFIALFWPIYPIIAARNLTGELKQIRDLSGTRAARRSQLIYDTESKSFRRVPASQSWLEFQRGAKVLKARTPCERSHHCCTSPSFCSSTSCSDDSATMVWCHDAGHRDELGRGAGKQR